MKSPGIYTVGYIYSYLNKCTTLKEIDDKWEPCRPEGSYSLLHRIKAAWMIFTGKGDVLIWPGKQ